MITLKKHWKHNLVRFFYTSIIFYLVHAWLSLVHKHTVIDLIHCIRNGRVVRVRVGEARVRDIRAILGDGSVTVRLNEHATYSESEVESIEPHSFLSTPQSLTRLCQFGLIWLKMVCLPFFQSYPEAQLPAAIPPLVSHSVEVKQVPFRKPFDDLKPQKDP